MRLLVCFLAAAVPATPAPAVPPNPSTDLAADAPTCCDTPSRWAVVAARAVSQRLAVEPCEAGARVSIDGRLFAEYVTDTGQQPAVWPIVGPSGHEMTRSYPLGELKASEKDDHPHHQSLWFSHGGVNGIDFWHRHGAEDAETPRIRHREFLQRGVHDGVAVVRTRNDWVGADGPVLEDTRTVVFGVAGGQDGGPSPRYIDFTVTLHAAYGPADFTDTKEGTFAVRVPGAMKVDAGLGGAYNNDAGQTNGAAWGRTSAWVDYRGPLTPDEDGDRGGVLILSHPESFRPRPRWHVREYGLFAANPFGVKDFPAGGPEQALVRLEKGERLTLRYRVVFYAGALADGAAQQFSDTFAATPLDAYSGTGDE